MTIVRLALWLGLSLTCAFAFHERYWRWRDCFNELGRCYDSEASMMTEAAGPIWAALTLLFAALAARALWEPPGTTGRPSDPLIRHFSVDFYAPFHARVGARG